MIDFPNTPAVDDTYTDTQGVVWYWNGVAWRVRSEGMYPASGVTVEDAGDHYSSDDVEGVLAEVADITTAAQDTADTAVVDAAAAQNTADTAIVDAAAAQSTADSAATDAAAAQTAASTAVTTVATVQVVANEVTKASGQNDLTIWRGTQAAYDAIGTPDADTMYLISG